MLAPRVAYIVTITAITSLGCGYARTEYSSQEQQTPPTPRLTRAQLWC